jgi:hypothetical protein
MTSEAARFGSLYLNMTHPAGRFRSLFQPGSALRGMLGVLLLFIVVRAALAIWTWGVRQAFPDTFPGNVTDLYKGVLLETNPWLEPWQRWDTLQYQAIAGRGYAAFETALFTPPLYPFLMRIAGPFFGGDTLASGLFISGLAALLGLVGLYQMARFEFGNDQDALRAALFFAVFPTAVFLYAAYSESLFLAAGILCLYFTRRENWILTGLFGALAALTRMPGSLLVFVLAYAAWKAWRQGDRRCWIAVTLTGLGAVAYPAYVWLGLHRPPTDILAALNARGGMLTFPGLNLVEAARRIFSGQLVAENVIELGFSLVFIVLTIFIWKRLPRIYGVYAITLMVFFLTRIGSPQPLVSMARYVLEIFPAFLLLAIWGRNAWVHRLILYLSWLGLLYFSAQFAIWGWVG